jgi:tetratricopeptide (TPR) repeat protein
MNLLVLFLLIFYSSFTFSKENTIIKPKDDFLIVNRSVLIGTNSQKARDNYNLGIKAFQKKDYKQAVIHYKEAIRLDPEYVEALDNCGLSFRKMGDLKSAEYFYQESIKVNPRTVAPHMNMAVIHSSRGEFEKALNDYQAIININPNDPEGFYGIAHVFLLQKKYQKALEASQKATGLYALHNPELLNEAYFSIGRSYLGLNDKKNAKKWIKAAIKKGQVVDPQTLEKAGLFAELGLMEIRAGNKIKGSQLIHKACLEKDLDGCFLEGINYLEDNKLKEAGKLLKYVCDAGDLYGCFALSVVEDKKGNKKSAVKYLDKSCSGSEKFQWCK